MVVGTGWIGSEAAASIRQLGRDVTLIGPDRAPLTRVLGPEIGAVYRDLHADHGVRLPLGTRRRRHPRPRPGRGVVTDDGRTIDCDLVLIGVGAVPRTELAEAAGLAGRNGVLVNEQLEAVGAPECMPPATSPPPGTPATRATCASSTGPTPSTRARPRPATCSASPPPMRGCPTSTPTSTTSAWSTPGTRPRLGPVVVRGDPTAREFIAFWLKDQRVVAGMNANVWDVTEPIQGLIRSGLPVDPARLADPDIPLDQVTGDRRTGPTNRYAARPPHRLGDKVSRPTDDQAAASSTTASGQSPWLDNLTRDYLRDGTLGRLVTDGIRGVTANPTIFARAIEGSDAYDEQFAALIAQGRPVTGRLLGPGRRRHRRRARRAATDLRRQRRHRRVRVDRGGARAGPRHRRHHRRRSPPAPADRPAEPVREDPGHRRGRARRPGDDRRGTQHQHHADLLPGPLRRGDRGLPRWARGPRRGRR